MTAREKAMQSMRAPVETDHWWTELCGPVDRRTRTRFRKLGRECLYLPDAMIVAEGTRAGCFSIIIHGEVEVFSDGVVIATLGRDEFFGEIAMLYTKPEGPSEAPQSIHRTATVRASTSTWVRELDRAELVTLMDLSPQAATRITEQAIGRLAAMKP